MTKNQRDTLPLADIDRALMPLRRLLGRHARRDAQPAHATTNLGRLFDRARTVELPVPLLAMLEDAYASMVEGDYATASQWIRRLDATLGLPLESVTVKTVTRDLAAQTRPEPKPKPARKPVQPAAEPVVANPPEPLPPLRFDMSLADAVAAEDARVLTNAGIETVGDVVLRHPVAERVLKPICGAGRELPDGEIAIGGRVIARVSTLSPSGEPTGQVWLQGAGRQLVRWSRAFDAADLKRLSVDSRVVLTATCEAGDVHDASWAAGHQGAVHVLDYGLAEAEETFSRVRDALIERVGTLEEVLPKHVISRAGGVRIADAIRRVHTRGSSDADARRRLALDELVTAQLARSWSRFQGGADRGISHQILHGEVAVLGRETQRRALGDDEQYALESIKRDLRRSGPMRRVLFGGASSSMDEVALRASVMVAESRNQVLILLPDNPSAMVRHDTWGPLFRSMGHAAMMLTGEPRRAEGDALRRGETHVVFAGPGVPIESLTFRRLGLVVSYEQAVHGITQEKLESRRSPHPDLLVVCRSPLSGHALDEAYATMDLSWLTGDEVFATGHVWGESDRESAYAEVGKAVSRGGSAIVAMPLTRDGADLLDLKAAQGLLGTLAHQVFDGAPVGLFHGGMSSSERSRVLTDFYERRVRVLVSTTALELVGPMPRGVVGLFDHADRMDLERLLGFRAQVTPKGTSHYVVGAEPDALGVEAVRLLAAGVPDPELVLEISRLRDAELPPKDVSWTWADPAVDRELSILARETVHTILSDDVALRQGNHPRILRRAHSLWPTMSDTPAPWPPPRGGGKRRRRRRRRR